MTRTKYSDEFKERVVREILEKERTIASVAASYDLVPQTVGVRVDQAQEEERRGPGPRSRRRIGRDRQAGGGEQGAAGGERVLEKKVRHEGGRPDARVGDARVECRAAQEMKVMALRSRRTGGGFKPPHAAGPVTVSW